MSGDSTPTLALDGWDEQHYERGTYGPGDRAGVEAVFERGSMTLAVRPVRYACRDGHEEIRGLTTGQEYSRDLVTALPDVRRRTAFATHAEYRPYSAAKSAVACVAHNADDALAAAAWLADGVTDDRDLHQHVRLHRGEQLTRSQAAVSDDDVLAALFSAEPDRCVLTGRPTTSHRIELPYRYFPALDGSKRTPQGVVRVPSTVRSLVGAVSHTAWEDENLDAVAFGAPLERVDAGTWALDDDVLRAVDGANAADFALERLGGN